MSCKFPFVVNMGLGSQAVHISEYKIKLSVIFAFRGRTVEQQNEPHFVP